MWQGLLVAPELACELPVAGIGVSRKLPCFLETDSFLTKTVDIYCRSHIRVQRCGRDWSGGTAVGASQCSDSGTTQSPIFAELK
ncbi:hypothetical protein [Treponema pectinovorum]|uniref:hypothetical protein n=1 Tax=Treponema pectinovorum TaxID=164 RepID=UPI0011CB9CFA|nr:hypothetical protein [Treponema pectinovorum]